MSAAAKPSATSGSSPGGEQRAEGRIGFADVLTLVEVGVANDHDSDIGAGGDGSRPVDVGPVVMDDVGERGAEPVQDGPTVEIPDVAGPAVTDVDGVGQAAQHGDTHARIGEREHRGAGDELVAQQDDGAGCDLTGELTVRRGAQHIDQRRRGREDLVEAQHRRHDVLDGAVDVLPCGIAALEGGSEVLGAHHSVGHLDVKASGQRRRCVAEAVDPVADDEPLEPPLVAQDVRQQLAVLAAPFTVDAVVGRHHRRHTLVDDPTEVRQVDLVKGDLVDLDVDGETCVLHRVAREVLDARHHVALQPSGQCRAELTDVVRVLAVGFLGSSPRRVAQHVDAHSAGEVGPDRAQLPSHGLADPLFQSRIPGRAAGHRHRETRRIPHHRASWAVDEADTGNSDSLDLASHEGRLVVAVLPGQELEARPRRRIAIQAPQPLVWAHPSHQRPGCSGRRCPRCHRRTSVIEGLDAHG